MADPGRAEIVKWRWLILLVTVPGIALFSLSLIPGKYKIMLALPLYAMFVYVFYKYLSVRKEASAAANRDGKQTPQTTQTKQTKQTPQASRAPRNPQAARTSLEAVEAGKGNRGTGTPAKKSRKKR